MSTTGPSGPPSEGSWPSLSRRALLLGLGAGAGLLTARGLGASRLLDSAAPLSAAEALRALGASLTESQRELVVLPADHPSRQIVNTLSVLERPHLGTLLSAEQRALVDALYRALLSPRGRADLAGTIAVEGRLGGAVLAIYGEPTKPGAHAVIMGGHLMLRGGSPAPDGSAFGGGVAYGHQIGDRRWRVEGNAFAHHGDAANQLFATLGPGARARAILPAPPHELVLQPRAADATFPGVGVAELDDAAREAAARLLAQVLGSYPDDARARTTAAIDHHGGIGAVRFAVYESHGFYEGMARYADLDDDERARRGDPYWQVWRLEGPGTVIHFQGWPHVHAYVQIVRDPAHANVGETLGATAAGVEGEAMRRLLEGALRRATGEPLAYLAPEAPGRFCPGEITTGLAWALDPYRNHVVVATLPGRAMSAALRERLVASGALIDDATPVRVATIDYLAGRRADFGEPERVERGDVLVRDALVAHLRAGGLAEASSGPDATG